MELFAAIARIPIASGDSWLITPNVGLMVWTFVVFGISLFILSRAVFPRIRDALDERRHHVPLVLRATPVISARPRGSSS